MPFTPPPPLVPDFTPGFDRLRVGSAVMPVQFKVPSFTADGELGWLKLDNSPLEAATNPTAVYPDHSQQARTAQLSAVQLKSVVLALLFQVLDQELGWNLAQQPGDIVTGGREGTWLVVR